MSATPSREGHTPRFSRWSPYERLLRAGAPLLVLTVLCVVRVLCAHEPAGRLHLELAWMPPSSGALLGYGDGGVELSLALAQACLQSLVLALGVVAVAFAIGTPLGALGGLVAPLRGPLARACDLVQAFPSFLLALTVLAAVKHPTRLHLALVFSVTAWAPFARMALFRAQVLSGQAFMEAALALGASAPRVLFLHMIPNLLGPVLVQAGSSAAAVVLGEAALAFLGFGPQDGISLGSLLEQGALGMLHAHHSLLFPALAITCMSFGLQRLSDGLSELIP